MSWSDYWRSTPPNLRRKRNVRIVKSRIKLEYPGADYVLCYAICNQITSDIVHHYNQYQMHVGALKEEHAIQIRTLVDITASPWIKRLAGRCGYSFSRNLKYRGFDIYEWRKY